MVYVAQQNCTLGGNFVGRFDFDQDRFGFLDLEEEIQKLGYVSWKRLVYKVPRLEVFKSLKDDKDVMQMLSHVSNGNEVLHIYVDGGKKVEGNVDDNKLQNESNGGEENDSEYVFSDGEEVTDDNMSAEVLYSEDDEYLEAIKSVRGNSTKGILDDVLGFSTGEGGFSDYENSDEDIYSSSTDDEGERFRQKIKRIVYDPKCDHKNLRITIGMKFQDGYQAREALKTNAIENGWQIHFKRVTKNQMEAYCTSPCKWRCYGSLVTLDDSFIIKIVEGVHTCPRAMRNKQVSSSWIAKKYLNVFRVRPEITVKELGKDILERYACHTTIWKLYKAKDKAIEQLRGSVEQHYAKLRSYILELLRVDREGRFELKLDVGAIFKGIYIGFSTLKKGFNVGCRRVIGLDGAFLKTYLGGVLLCAIGKDGNESDILMEELGLRDGLGITFISDQQKGLINAIQDLAPFATHRNCARHVYSNWKKNPQRGNIEEYLLESG
ncbi:uncharacterized protein LOC131010184 [Salvia miltiorrhiza]|uniref:uncharacterized protein LOC131010184 n=1 Tax=Salvia miltiorrhiza TaxID=226208 RepID=UPI0025AC48D3|nr:uncharacterized protein LOC131010184 [Salvia miltiorrhiza]